MYINECVCVYTHSLHRRAGYHMFTSVTPRLRKHPDWRRGPKSKAWAVSRVEVTRTRSWRRRMSW